MKALIDFLLKIVKTICILLVPSLLLLVFGILGVITEVASWSIDVIAAPVPAELVLPIGGWIAIAVFYLLPVAYVIIFIRFRLAHRVVLPVSFFLPSVLTCVYESVRDRYPPYLATMLLSLFYTLPLFVISLAALHISDDYRKDKKRKADV